jgi:hypothetical protein
MANWLQAVGRLLRQDQDYTSYAWSDRQYAYLLWDGYYANTIYETLVNGGQRENINATLGNAAAADLGGLYNPVANVVDLYLHVFDGAFGDEIRVEPQGAATVALVDAIEQLWKWSNLTIEKQPLCRFAATHGTVGLRIVARNPADLARRRVWIKPEHPRTIRDVEMDERGNVEAIQLEYELTTGLAENAQTICIREELTKEEFRTYRMVGGNPVPFDLTTMEANGPNARYDNALGIVPYVLLRHEYNGETFGRNAWYKARSPVDRLNALMSHIDVQIHRHVKAKWFIAADGAPPTSIDLDDLSVAYVNTHNSTSTPVVQPLVAPLDLSGAIAEAKLQMDVIEDMLPELKATQGKFLSGQSGETIVELRKPAEEKIALARANYEDALVRAQQIAVSWGVLLGLWDVGTGMGSREAADAAFHGGYEDYRFNTRPLLLMGSGKIVTTQQPAGAVAPPAAADQTQTQQMMGAQSGKATAGAQQ